MALLLLPAVRGSKNERDAPPGGLLIALSRVPAAVAARRPGLLSRGCCCSAEKAGSGCGGSGPEEAGQLPGDRDDRHVVGLAAGAHAGVDAV